MSEDVVPAPVTHIATHLRPEADDVIRAMDEHTAETGFPTVGPDVGAWLALLARLTTARRVFEFGSGFGYSAYWFTEGMPDGEVVLTEIDEAELAQAREFFARGDRTDRARFEHGDALDIVKDYQGPFDIALIDNEKERYVEAFEAIRPKLADGGLIVADNAVTAGDVVNREEVVGLLEGTVDPEAVTSGSRGIVAYLDHVRAADGCSSVLLPLGEGLVVTLVE